ncbi:hypothetical protein AHMF7605_08975 [Adhaeribacter arboris]|uniref:Uncharacterized protein n=1 Tax=Adhaeribacter arboris TaxID=2072846 RepID=A0A2T2YDR3_9BACT|nr:hypothetical protein [Adhaeribacter arboris]PSR53646.1 hypothetical protein AHMF7605_08975 [Adhaeribacter arboris]
MLVELIEEYYPEKGYSSDYLLLTAETLEIKHHSHRYILPLDQIESIDLRHIRLLFYYLAGGFTVTLSLIAILSYFISPLPGLLLVLLGIIGLYFGLKGKISLQISTTTDDYVFWFSGKYPPFLKFINAVRHRIIMQSALNSENLNLTEE